MNTNKTNTNNSGNPPNFGKSFLNQNKKRKSGYSVPLFGKTGLFLSIIAIFVCAVIVFAVSFKTPEKLSARADKKFEQGNYKDALSLYLEATAKGHSGDEAKIGSTYYNLGTEGNKKEALEWFKKGAENKQPEAEYNLGNMYFNGEIVQKNLEEALKYWKLAADKDYKLAKTALDEHYENEKKDADSLYDSSKYKEALKKYLEVYDQGHKVDEVRIGYMYGEGQGVAQDYSEAVKWYRKAAEQGNALGQFNLGYMYQYGEGVDKDYAEAVKWYRKSAEQGNASGQCNLGYMYENGYGVEKDYAEAVKWYRKSAEQGNAVAQNNLGYMYENGYGGVDKDEDEAIKLYEKSATQGNETAKNNLKRLKEKKAKEAERQRQAEEARRRQEEKERQEALRQEQQRKAEQEAAALKAKALELSKEADSLYDSGKYKEALEKYLEAYDKGYRGDEFRIGYIYDEGRGVVENNYEAVKWYSRAAERGSAAAQFNMGYMYKNGEGVEKDYDEAVRWYRKAAEQGHASAQCNLGYMYDNGLGVSKNKSEAKKWYEKAVAQGNETAKNNLKILQDEQDQEEARQRQAEEERRRQQKIARYKKGDVISFGDYPFYADGRSEAIDWIILNVYSNGNAMLISRYVLDAYLFSNTGYAEPWERSAVMNWLNNVFISSAFSSREQESIVRNYSRGTNFKVRLLSEAEAMGMTPSERMVYPTPYAAIRRRVSMEPLYPTRFGDGSIVYLSYWWLNTPSMQVGMAMHIHPDGSICSGHWVNDASNGVRPVLFIDLDKYVDLY